MENINPLVTNSTDVNQALPSDLLKKQAYTLVFKEILNSLITNNETDDAFKSDEDKEASLGLPSEFSHFSDQFINSFVDSTEGQQILNQFY